MGPHTKHPPQKHPVHLPAQSWYPFVSALGLVIVGYGLVYESWLLSILPLIVVTASFYAWAFEGVGGTYVEPEPSDVELERHQLWSP